MSLHLKEIRLEDSNYVTVATWTGYAVPDYLRAFPNENARTPYTLVIGSQRQKLEVGADVYDISLATLFREK